MFGRVWRFTWILWLSELVGCDWTVLEIHFKSMIDWDLEEFSEVVHLEAVDWEGGMMGVETVYIDLLVIVGKLKVEYSKVCREMSDERWQMRDNRWEMTDERWEMRDERWEMRDEKREMRDERWEMRGWLGGGESQSLDDAVLIVWSTRSTQYAAYALLGACVRRIMQSPVHAVLSVCCNWCMQCLVYAALSACSIQCMQHSVDAVLGVCSAWDMLHLVLTHNHGMK